MGNDWKSYRAGPYLSISLKSEYLVYQGLTLLFSCVSLINFETTLSLGENISSGCHKGSMSVLECVWKSLIHTIFHYIPKFKTELFLWYFFECLQRFSDCVWTVWKVIYFFPFWWINKVSSFKLLCFIFSPLLMELLICDLSKVLLYIRSLSFTLLGRFSLDVTCSWLALLKWTGLSTWPRAIFEVEGKKYSLLEEMPILSDRGFGFRPCI